MNILNSEQYKCNVSSVLNKDTKQNGKGFMFDDKEDTAWYSDQGLPQWIKLEFNIIQKINSFNFQFQGGFAGKNCIIIIENENNECIYKDNFYPDDINSLQLFKLVDNHIDNVKKIKFLFETSTDLFGRIIVYKLEIF